MKLWARRYHGLGSLHTQLVCRLHAVLCDLVPGGFARQISAAQAIQVLTDIAAHDPVAAARLELAHDLVADLYRIDEQHRDLKRRGNRQLNHAIHVAAVTQIRDHGTTGRSTTTGSAR
jgi:hypothetical protein